VTGLSVKWIPLVSVLGVGGASALIYSALTGQNDVSAGPAAWAILAGAAVGHLYPVHRLLRRRRAELGGGAVPRRLVRRVQDHVLAYALVTSWSCFAVAVLWSPFMLLLWLPVVLVLVKDFWPGFLSRCESWRELGAHEIIDKMLVETAEMGFIAAVLLAGIGAGGRVAAPGGEARAGDFPWLAASAVVAGATALFVLYAGTLARRIDASYRLGRVWLRIRERLRLWFWCAVLMGWIVVLVVVVAWLRSSIPESGFAFWATLLLWTLMPVWVISGVHRLGRWRWGRVAAILAAALATLALVDWIRDPFGTWLAAAVLAAALVAVLLYGGDLLRPHRDAPKAAAGQDP